MFRANNLMKLAFVLAITIFLNACSGEVSLKEEISPVSDTEKPSRPTFVTPISAIFTDESTYIYDWISTDNNSVTSYNIKVYAGENCLGSPISEINQQENTFNTLLWNGPRTISVIAYDQAGNQSDSACSSEVIKRGLKAIHITKTASSAFNYIQSEIVIMNGVKYFINYARETGYELWKNDGINPSQIVKDIYVGPHHSTPQNLVILGNTIYFSADDGIHGRELWKSDGTESGTVLVKDINLGAMGSDVKNIFIAGTKLYFSASDGSTNNEPWISDGTEAGTALLKDINTGSLSSNPNSFFIFNNEVFFLATTSANGNEIWKSNGTGTGTVLFKDINPGALSSSAQAFTIFNGLLYFSAYNGSQYQFLKTDGTINSTTEVKSNFTIREMKILNNKLIMSAALVPGFDIELWQSDGSLAGTVLIKNINSTASSSANSLTIMSNKIYFWAYGNGTGGELWSTDGTESGTVLVKDINAGPSHSLYGSYSEMHNFGSNILFFANDGVHGLELWSTDGTESGTAIFADFFNGVDSSFVNIAGNPKLKLIDGMAYFVANSDFNQISWYETDGSAAGTKSILNESAVISTQSTYGAKIFNGSIYFFTTGGWLLAKNLQTGESIQLGQFGGSDEFLGELNGKLYFIGGKNDTGHEVWETDGTLVGTKIIKDSIPGVPGLSLVSLSTDRYLPSIVLNNHLIFAAVTSLYGIELWKTDGTPEGTGLIKDIWTGADSGYSQTYGSPAVLNGKIYFSASDNGSNIEVWSSDGTDIGTNILGEIMPGTIDASSPGFFVNLGNLIYFAAYDTSGSSNLYSSNGTSITLVKDFSPGFGVVDNIIVQNNVLYFGAHDSTSGAELWKSDGTTSGTSILKDITPGVDNSFGNLVYPYPTQLDQNRFIFYTEVLVGADYHMQLWSSDGTSSGTQLVKTFGKYYPDSIPKKAGSKIYFNIRDSTGKVYLMSTDGTLLNTNEITGFDPGDEASMGYAPYGFVFEWLEKAILLLNRPIDGSDFYIDYR